MKNQFLTIPNIISALRFIAIPVFVFILFGIENRLAAAFLLGGMAATDWVDGYLARKLNQETSIGRILDPTVDRVLALVAIISLLIDETLPFGIGITILAREAIIVTAVLVLAFMKLDTIKVNWFGKAGTFALFWSLPLFLLAGAKVPSGVEQTAEIAAWITGIGGVVLGYMALSMYIPAVKTQLKERKQGNPEKKE